MANIQYGSTSGKIPIKKNLIKDLGNVAINTALSPIEGLTGKNFFNPEMTTGFGKSAAGVGDFLGNVTGAVAPMALNMVAPGAGTALGAVAKGVGNSIDADPTSGAGVAMGSALGSLAGNKDVIGLMKDVLKYGGKIHIDPKNKGKFNALKAKTGKTTEELTHSKNPLTKKRAIFSQNAAKWKHAVGGLMDALQTQQTSEYADGGIILPTYINMPENNEHAMGGNLTRYNGMKHEDGGIPISNTDEVEGGETSFQQGSQNPNDPGTFIFSDSILVPGTKKTFADESKKIDNRYKKRENDVWATNAKKMQLGKLAELQEQVKGTTQQQGMQMSPDGSVHKMGGKLPSMMKANGTSRYNLSKKMMNMHPNGGGVSNYSAFGNKPLVKNNVIIPNNGGIPGASFIEQPITNVPIGVPQVTSNTTYKPTTRNINNNQSVVDMNALQKSIAWTPPTGNVDVPNGALNSTGIDLIEKDNWRTPELDNYVANMMNTNKLDLKEIPSNYKAPSNKNKSDMIIPMAGYGLQALTNLPMLLAKPNKATYDRITPEKVDLTGQRLEAQGSRNKALSVARRNASMLGSASAINSFNGAAISDIYGKYGDQINNSLMNEKNTNAGIVNDTRGKNAQIQMAEVEANQREADAVRSAKQQALFNIGQSTASAGKTYGNMQEQDNQMNWLDTSNPDYGIRGKGRNNNPYRKGYKCGGKLKKGNKK